MKSWILGLCLLCGALVACGGDPPPSDGDADADGDVDLDGDADGDADEEGDGSQQCSSDEECTDGAFCTGEERCDPDDADADDFGCVAGESPCPAGEVCEEELHLCVPEGCEVLDADGDGHRSEACGGDDCDDNDTNRYPGNVEVCDGEGHDEDCNTDTFGFLDADGDGSASSACCNGVICGGDCNDADSLVNDRVGVEFPLYCDGIDNNCDGSTDERCPCEEGDTRDCGTPAQIDGIGTCEPGTQICSGGAFTEECIGGVAPQEELCDGQDNDCDGTNDEGVLRSYVVDADGDGFGAIDGEMIEACSPPEGYAIADTDCDDSQRSISPLAAEVCNGVDDDCDTEIDEGVVDTYWLDADGDGFGGPLTEEACSPPEGYVTNTLDCDDSNRTINPPAPERCDLIDNNCDEDIDVGCDCTDGTTQLCGASDGAGGILTTGACEAGEQRCLSGGWDTCSGSIGPTLEECNGRDDDCDGEIDEGVLRTFYHDGDGDGFGALDEPIEACFAPTGYVVSSSDCNDRVASINPAAVDVCDDQDNDCDGTPDLGCDCTDGATRACGYDDGAGGFLTAGECEAGSQRCAGGSWGPCIGQVGPRVETCNELDDDCDGPVDEGVENTYYLDNDGDGFGDLDSTAEACTPPASFVNNSNDCNDAAAGVNPAAPESCDGIDNNCGGGVDEGCDCTDGSTRSCGEPDGAGGFVDEGECLVGSQRCLGGAWEACTGAVTPRAEFCNGLDDDCDGDDDEGVENTYYLDNDGDGFGDLGSPVSACSPPPSYVPNSTDCDDTRAAINPAATEICDGVNNNCDASTDPGCDCLEGESQECGEPDGSGGVETRGECVAGSQVCVAGTWTGCAGAVLARAETCNELDDDCDGQIDEGLIVDCWADPDDDGWSVAGATMETFCPVAGRLAEGGCPIFWTFRAPGTDDCADDDPDRFPGQTELCNDIDDDCDGEVDEGTAAECAVPNAYGACLVGSCAIVGCEPGFADCDGLRSNGCEVDTLTESEHCGGCGLSCGGGGCTDRLCELPDGLGYGSNHGCMTFPSGQVACWGYNNSGQLGDGTTLSRPYPAPVTGITDATGVSGGAWFSCAVHASGGVSCWGNDNDGQLGDGAGYSHTSTPISVVGLSGATQVDAGSWHVCARRSTGAVSCWGDNDNGQLGDNTITDRFTPVAVSALSDATMVSCGNDHSCARRSGGGVRCWGDNAYGQLGDGTTTDRHTPVNVLGLAGATAVAAGSQHSCAIHGAGAVSCWGEGSLYRLGDGTTADHTTPVAATGISDAVDVSLGWGHTCAVRATGAVMCWGYNSYGQLGDGTTTNRSVPTTVPGLTGAVAVRCGQYSTCALRDDGRVLCWGNNGLGELGDGTLNERHSPTAIPSIGAIFEVTTLGDHSCARRGTGEVYCWGRNTSGQIGDATTTNRTSARAVNGANDDYVGVSAGSYQSGGGSPTCAVRSTGEVDCWGENYWGQLGDGSTTDRWVPTAVSGLVDAVEVSTGTVSTCALRETGEVVCWGFGNWGALGQGSSASSSVPVDVVDLDDAVRVAVGDNFACALRATGRVSCWGANDLGQGGHGGAASVSVPTDVTDLTDAVDIVTGGDHACARRSDRSLVCWGANGSGQLGDGTSINRIAPVSVIGLTQVVSVDAGRNHTCARRITGELFCWGANGSGQLGDGSTANRPAPIAIGGLGFVSAVTAGGDHTCVQLSTREVGCWGDNAYGQLGDGSTVPRISYNPVTGL